MWSWVFDNVQRLVLLTHQVRETSAGLKNLQKEVSEVTRRVDQLAHELERDRQSDQHEREKILLRIQNELLLLERRLPNRDRN